MDANHVLHQPPHAGAKQLNQLYNLLIVSSLCFIQLSIVTLNYIEMFKQGTSPTYCTVKVHPPATAASAQSKPLPQFIFGGTATLYFLGGGVSDQHFSSHILLIVLHLKLKAIDLLH